MKVEYLENEDGSLEVKLTFDSMEVDCLKHDLPGVEGIVDWYSQGPASEKLYRCKERMLKEWIPKLREKGKTISSDDTSLIQEIITDENYEDRKKRNEKTELEVVR